MEAIQLAVFCETLPSEQQAKVQGVPPDKPRQFGIVPKFVMGLFFGILQNIKAMLSKAVFSEIF